VKALTLLQPWAQLMADGRKQYETRSWYPWHLKPGDLLAITASARMGAADKDCADAAGYELRDLPLGKVVAVVRFLEAHKTEHTTVSEEERCYGDYTPGRFAWRCDEVFKLPEPIPVRGALGVWALPDEIKRSIASLMVQQAATR
jgi:hypothetical protein